MGARLARLTTPLLLAALVTGAGVGVGPAGGARAVQVGPGTPGLVGVVGSTVDAQADGGPQAFTGARLWDENVNWCDLQPTAGTDLATSLASILAPKLDRLVASGTDRVLIPLGHPAPWVFEDHWRARAAATRWSKGSRPVWFCQGRASAISIPDPASLTPGPDGQPTLQQQRFSEYVGALVAFVVGRYGDDLAVDLQVWNEPNLYNGIDPALRIPGTARTTSAVVASLRAYERLANAVIQTHPQARLRLVSPSWYQRTNTMVRTYLKAQNREPTVAALAFNVYSRRQTPDAMVADWDSRANKIAKLVAAYPNLRGLPRLVTETNHNLNNHKPSDRSNSAARVTAAAVQTRLASATQLNAWFRGFSEVHWLLPMRNQAAVALQVYRENPARMALAELQRAIGPRELTGCGSQSGTRVCYFQDPSGVLAPARALWRMSGWRNLRIDSDSMVETLSAPSLQIAAGQTIRVGTNPVLVISRPS